jgi:hypothetical protein
MSDKMQGFGQLDDQQVNDLRNQLRDFVSGVKDPGSSFLEALIAGHSKHVSGHSNDVPKLPGDINPNNG